jgi:hypothetical protein
MEVTTKRFIKFAQKRLDEPDRDGGAIVWRLPNLSHLKLVACPKELSFNATRFKAAGSSFSDPVIFQNQKFSQPAIREVVHESRGAMRVTQPNLTPSIGVHLLTNLSSLIASIGKQKAPVEGAKKPPP